VIVGWSDSSSTVQSISDFKGNRYVAAVTKPDGTVAHTYSWGNDANLRGWSKDRPLDLKTGYKWTSGRA
jgi:hypothetical protein